MLMSIEEREIKYRERQRRYRATEKWRETHKRYVTSPERVAARARYDASPKGAANRARYLATPAGAAKRKASQARYAALPKSVAARARYAASPKGKVVISGVMRKHRYGVTQDQIDHRLTAQGGLCGICGVDITGIGKAHVDHDHNKKKGDPGFIRGLLCGTCNRGGGLFRDNPALLQRAAVWFS